MSSGRDNRCAPAMLIAGLLCAAPAAADPTLSLQIPSPVVRYFPGDSVVVTLRVSDLGGQAAAGFQAFLEYDPAELTFVAASYTASPFGEPIITPIDAVGGQIDMAAGLDLPAGQMPMTTDATLVTMAFTANQVGCISSVQFRPHDPPTRVTTASAMEIGPLTLSGLPPEPLLCGCPCEYDGNSSVNVFDLLVYLDFWFQDDAQAELDGSPGVDVFDLLAFLDCWFPASAGQPCP